MVIQLRFIRQTQNINKNNMINRSIRTSGLMAFCFDGRFHLKTAKSPRFSRTTKAPLSAILTAAMH